MTKVFTSDGVEVETIVEVPLIEDLPKGFMAVREGRRITGWRNDLSASIVYAEALDGGDPANEVEYRDAVYQLDAPFDRAPRALIKTINRFSGIPPRLQDPRHRAPRQIQWRQAGHSAIHQYVVLPARP